jgi:hypothetical protein
MSEARIFEDTCFEANLLVGYKTRPLIDTKRALRQIQNASPYAWR